MTTTASAAIMTADQGMAPDSNDDDDDIDNDDDPCGFRYLPGFGNELSSEVLPGAVPVGRNNPRVVPYGLYTEQLSGTSFTTCRSRNRRTWLYRIRPLLATMTTVAQDDPQHAGLPAGMSPFLGKCDPATCVSVVDPIRWNPLFSGSSGRDATSTTSAVVAATTAATPTTTKNDDQTTTTTASRPNDDDDDHDDDAKQEEEDQDGAGGGLFEEEDFLDGFYLMACAGEPRNRLAIYQYRFPASGSGGDDGMVPPSRPTGRPNQNKNNQNTIQRFLSNTDGDWLIVPQHGSLVVTTELGRLYVAPREICVVPRNIYFHLTGAATTMAKAASGGGGAVTTTDEDDAAATAPETKPAQANANASFCTGYVLEVDSPIGWEMPERGVLGANGLANARDFLFPTAYCAAEPTTAATEAADPTARPILYHLYTKQNERLSMRTITHHPCNVVGWHGNYLPYKYHLDRFCAMNSVTYDHPDPSIHTVLTCASPVPGTALADFVVFVPHRNLTATDNDTYRPPWFHRNVMSEYMGLIDGTYDAKTGGGFLPGGASLHNLGVPHGPDAVTHAMAIADPGTTAAGRPGGGTTSTTTTTTATAGMAFMFETYLPLLVNPTMLAQAQPDYLQCWRGLDDHFTGWEQLMKQQRQQQQQQNSRSRRRQKRQRPSP
jgi:homogentisate 1,2-dioxygenase/ribosomal protein L12E/L44/L45/RPP1/RPP2